jgi:hypothetical protein
VPAEQTVNRAAIIEWLDELDIEVTDRQMAGLFHDAAPGTASAPGRLHQRAGDEGGAE